MVARGALGKRGEGAKKHTLLVTKYSQECKYSIGNIVNDIVTARYGARWDT